MDPRYKLGSGATMIGQPSQPATASPRKSRLHIPVQAVAVYTLAVAALIWVFHDLSWRDFVAQVSGMDLWWLAPAIAADIFSYWCQGYRWHFLLRPAGKISSLRATQAIYAGLFTNEVLPMRPGEAVAAFVVARWLNRPLAEVVPSMLVGRLLDGIWLAIALGLLMQVAPMPREIEQAGDWFAAAVALGILLFLLILIRGLRRQRPANAPSAAFNPPPTGLRRRVAHWISRVIDGVQEIRNPANLAGAAFFSLGILLFQGLAFWFVMKAYHLPVSLVAGFAVFLIVHLGTAIPNAPANVGSFQFFTVLGLGIFGVEKAQAAGFSAVVFLLLTLPLWILGAVALSRTGLSLASIRSAFRPQES
jgi:uncharacterized protein (TIRG00374 family)